MIRLAALLLLCAACGGGAAECRPRDATFAFHATAVTVDPGCENMPASLDVTATGTLRPDGSYLLSGTENGIAFTAQPFSGLSSDCYVSPAWFDSASSHTYFLSFAGGASRLDVVRFGSCMVIYSLH